MEKIITVENFTQEIEKSGKDAVIDFWATWCGPCKMIAPEIEKLAERMGDKIIVGKVNVDEQMPLAEKFGIQSIPTLLFFKNGRLENKSVGVITCDEIIKKFGL